MWSTPGERMPVIRRGGERPHDAAPAEPALHVRVVGHIAGIIVVDERTVRGPAEKQDRAAEQQPAHDRGANSGVRGKETGTPRPPGAAPETGPSPFPCRPRFLSLDVVTAGVCVPGFRLRSRRWNQEALGGLEPPAVVVMTTAPGTCRADTGSSGLVYEENRSGSSQAKAMTPEPLPGSYFFKHHGVNCDPRRGVPRPFPRSTRAH